MPTFIFALTPVDSTSFKSFFETGPISRLLANPGQLRAHGWDLMTSDTPRLVKGEYWEVRSAERKLIRAFYDGSVMVRVAADSTFLGWGRNADKFQQFPILNSLAVAEVCLNFAIFCREVVALLEPRPSTLDLVVGIRNAFFGNSKLIIVPSVNHPYGWNEGRSHTAPETRMHKHERIPSRDLFTSSGPGGIAFTLARIIYNWFGVPAEEVPYATIDGDQRVISPHTIKAVRS